MNGMPPFGRRSIGARQAALAHYWAVVPLMLLAALPAASQTQPASRPASRPDTQPNSRPQTRPTTRPETQPTDGQKLLTLKMIYGPRGRVNFSGSYARGMSWLPDGKHFQQRRDGVPTRIDAISGDEAGPVYDHEALEAALKAHADFDDRAARRLARRPSQFNSDRCVVLIQHQRRLYRYCFADGRLLRLTEKAESRREVALSPGGGYVSFVRDNNVYVINASTGQQRQLTKDGKDEILNGVLDWVYMEEVYGRGGRRAYWWRDDDQYLAYLQTHEKGVPVYTIVNQIPVHPSVEKTQYPKAGDPNPTVRLGVLQPDRSKTVWVDLSKYEDVEFLIVRVGWAPDGKLIYQVQDREQRWLDLNEADPETGHARTLLTETSPAWVDVFGQPHWLDDGSFLWRSARDGWRHLYHYARDGRLIRRVTAGDWDVTSLYGVDPETCRVYFSAKRDSPVETHAYRVKLAGGPLQRLTEPGYSHRTQFDPKFGFFIDTFSNITTPTKVYLRDSDGELVRVISENEVKVLAEYKLSEPELLRIPARDGYLLNALIVRPPNFDPQRKYPVWIGTYAGPYGPSVHNRWGGSSYMVRQMLAQKGYICCGCDPRSASGQGQVSAWQAYRRLGESELADLEDSVRWLIEHESADPERIGINGYSYGGFMTAYALTHSKMFSVGVAGAAVTDWHNYDSIYTERFMQTPQNNPDGYARTSCVKAGGDLHGNLLIVHGALDDNVHFQNTLQLISELQKNRKQFDLMVYPRDRHGIGHGRRHYTDLWLSYVYERL